MGHETFLECSEDWMATLSAYSMTYFSSQLFAENPVYDSDFFETFDSDSVSHLATTALFYAWFRLFWIHGSYPNYVLADVVTPSLGYQNDLAFDSDTADGTDPVWEMAEALAKNAAPDMLNSDGSLKSNWKDG